MTINVEQLLASVDLADLVRRYGVHLEKDGDEYKGLCPFHNERTPSFYVVPAKGFVHCFGCGYHEDAIQFVMDMDRVSFREACERLGAGNVVPLRRPDALPAPEPVDIYAAYEILRPVETDEPEFVVGQRTPLIFNPKRADDEARQWGSFIPTLVHAYRDEAGNLLGYVLRRDFGDGRKETPQIQYVRRPGPDRTECWARVPFREPRPLYGLELLAQRPEAPVVVVEGEKAADAVRRLLPLYVGITWPGGSNAPGKADWSPLKGRRVLLWPDADGAGIRAMIGYRRENGDLVPGVAQLAHAAGAVEIKVLSVDGMAKGWDAADALAEGWDTARVVAWAKPRAWIWSPDDAVEVVRRAVATAGKRAASKPAPAAEPPSPAPEDRGPPDLPPPEVSADKIGGGHFKPLGFDSGRFYFHSFRTGQVVSLTASSLTVPNMQQLAPLQFLSLQWPKGKGDGVDEAGARDALIRACEAKGVFDPSVIRGRGAWFDKGRCVLHLGDRLVVDGKPVELGEFDTRYVYERRVSMGVDYVQPASNAEAIKLVELLRMCNRFEERRMADLVAGWLFVAPVCGAMPWRSHLYITGAQGSGKSWIMDEVVGRYLAGIAFRTQGKTTEAAIRQHVRGDAIPVVYDEAEAEDARARERIQGVLDLARQAASPNGAPIHKGGVDGRGTEYHVRCTFVFSSINLAIRHLADETRAVHIRMRAPRFECEDEKEADAEAFRALEAAHAALFTEEWRAAMISRAVAMIPVLRKNHRTFAAVAGRRFGSRRLGDTLGMMLAGLYGLHSTKEISEEKAAEFINRQEWEDQERLAGESSERHLLATLLESEIRVELKDRPAVTRSIGELARLATLMVSDDPAGIDRDAAADALKRKGFVVDGGILWVSNTHTWIAKRLADTPWASQWGNTLARLPGAVRTKHGIRFKGTVQPVAKAVGVPIDSIE